MVTKIRPRQAWRVFAGEVGVIVLGVMIALGAQQTADEWRWRQDVARSKADLDSEILDAAALGAERVAVTRCLGSRLAELGAKIAASEGRWTKDRFRAGPDAPNEQQRRAIPVVYRAPSRVFTVDAWEHAKSSGILRHMKPEEVTNYSGIYEQIADIRTLNRDEWREIPGLSWLAFDGAMGADLRERALSKVATLDSYNSMIVLVSKQLALAAEKNEGRLSAATLVSLVTNLNNQTKLRGACVDSRAARDMMKPLMRN